ELLPFADQAAELRYLLQEGVRSLVLPGTVVTGLGSLGGRGVVVAEDVPSLDLAALQAIRKAQHVLDRQVERENRLAHLALAGLDLLRDRHLLLAGEEGNAAHLLEVHPDRVGGLARRALDFLGFGGLFRPVGLGRLLGRILGERGFLDSLDLDVHVAEHRDDLVELLGGGGFHRRVTRFFGCHRRLPGRRPRVPDAGLLLGSSLFHALHASGGRTVASESTGSGCAADLLGVQCWWASAPGCLRRIRSDREYLIVRGRWTGRGWMCQNAL